MVFNGKEFSQSIFTDLKNRISLLTFKPEFSDILVGNNGPSVRYVNMKKKTAHSLGINFIDGNLSESVTTDDVVNKIKELSNRPNMCGIIVQLPLPSHIDTDLVLSSVPLKLDVDGLSKEYMDLFYGTNSHTGMLIMPTVSAVHKILNKAINNDFNNKNIAIVGQGRLVGKPITHLIESHEDFIHSGGVVKTIDSSTDDDTKKEILKNADVIITAVGKPGVITGSDVKDGVVIIDAGTLEVENVLLGDTDFEGVVGKASFVTPTPGGVGPVTVACLMENIVIHAEYKNNLIVN